MTVLIWKKEEERDRKFTLLSIEQVLEEGGRETGPPTRKHHHHDQDANYGNNNSEASNSIDGNNSNSILRSFKALHIVKFPRVHFVFTWSIAHSSRDCQMADDADAVRSKSDVAG